MRYANSPCIAVCPICTHTKSKLLYKVSSKKAANHFLITQGIDKKLSTVIDDKIARLWNSKTAAVVECENCGFTFADPFIAGDHDFYNLLPHASGEGAEYWKWEFDKTFKKLPQ